MKSSLWPKQRCSFW